MHGKKAYGGAQVLLHSFIALALAGTEWSSLHPGGFNARKTSPVPTDTLGKSKVVFRCTHAYLATFYPALLYEILSTQQSSKLSPYHTPRDRSTPGLANKTVPQNDEISKL